MTLYGTLVSSFRYLFICTYWNLFLYSVELISLITFWIYMNYVL